MKTKHRIPVIFLIAIAVFAATLFGCADDTRPQSSGTIEQGYSACYAFTATETEVAAAGGEAATLKTYMDVLKADGKLAFEGEDGAYGYYIVSVLGMGSRTVHSDANSYSGYDWTIYTTLTTVDDVTYSSDETVFDYNGIRLYRAAYGVSGLPCIAGETYALVYEYSSMQW